MLNHQFALASIWSSAVSQRLSGRRRFERTDDAEYQLTADWPMISFYFILQKNNEIEFSSTSVISLKVFRHRYQSRAVSASLVPCRPVSCRVGQSRAVSASRLPINANIKNWTPVVHAKNSPNTKPVYCIAPAAAVLLYTCFHFMRFAAPTVEDHLCKHDIKVWQTTPSNTSTALSALLE